MSRGVGAHTQRLETSSFPATSAITVVGWGMLTKDSSVNRTLFSIVNTGNNADNLRVYVTGTEGFGMMRDNGDWSLGSVATITQDVWYRYALVVDGTTPTLYYGQLGSALSSSTGNSSDGPAVTSPKLVIGSDLAFSRFWDGNLAAFRAFDAVLTQTEVEREMDSLIWPARQTNLWGSWPLVGGDYLKDYSFGGSNTLSTPGGGTPTLQVTNPNGLQWGPRPRRQVFVASSVAAPAVRRGTLMGVGP